MANIGTLINAIRQAVKGLDVRKAIADGIEAINDEVESNTAGVNEKIAEMVEKTNEAELQADYAKQQGDNAKIIYDNWKDTPAGNFDSKIGDMTQIPDVDLITAIKKDRSDLIDIASDLITKMSKQQIQQFIGFADVNKNLSKIDSTMLTDSLLQMIAGTAGVNVTPLDLSVTTQKMANFAVTFDKLGNDIITKIFEGKNIFNVNIAITTGKYIDNSGNLQTSTSLGVSDFIEVIPNQYYTLPIASSTPGCLFDANKGFISQINYISGSTFQVPANARYIKVNVNTVDSANAIHYTKYMIAGGKNYPSQYTNYGVTGIPVMVDNAQLKDNSVDSNNMKGFQTNLFNKLTCSSGYIDNTGAIQASTALSHSDYIEVEAGKTYSIPSVGSTPGGFYDLNKNWISALTAISGSTTSFIVPANAKYIKVNVNVVDFSNSIFINNFMVIKNSTYTNKYTPYNLSCIPWMFNMLTPMQITPPLNGYAYNVDEGLRAYRAALAKFRVGLADLSIQNIGDSVGEGYYTLNNTKGYVYRLRQKLLDLNYSSLGDGLMGLYDYRLTTVSTGWTQTGGGAVINCGLNGGIGISPALLSVKGKRFGFVYAKNPIGGVGTVQIDNETPVTVDYTGSSSINIIWIDAQSDGQHTFKINPPSSNYALAKGIFCKSPLASGVGFTLHNMSRSGASSEDILGLSTYRDLMLQSTFDYSLPQLTMIELGLNDLNRSVPVSTYIANLRQLADKALTHGSVLFLIMSPCTVSGYDNYVNAVYTVATEKNCAVLDINKAFGVYSVSQPLGLFSDGTNSDNEGTNLHPSARGHQYISDLIAKIIL